MITAWDSVARESLSSKVIIPEDGCGRFFHQQEKGILTNLDPVGGPGFLGMIPPLIPPLRSMVHVLVSYAIGVAPQAEHSYYTEVLVPEPPADDSVARLNAQIYEIEGHLTSHVIN